MLTLEGKTYQVPGVYGTVEVIQLGSVALPVFNTLLIIGSARKGIPFNATGKKGYEVIKGFSSLTNVKDFYGVSELSAGMDYAKRGGAGVVFFCNLANLTRSLATVMDNAGTPVTCFDVFPRDNFYGAPGNDISLTIATASTVTTVTIIPPKLTKFLTQNASTSSLILFLEDVEGLAVGQNVYLTDGSATSPQATKIASIDTLNKKVTVANLPTAAYAISGYARMYQEDTNKQQIITFDNTTTSVEALVALINTGNIVTADRKTYLGVLPTTLAKQCLQNFTSATKAISPVATETVGGDYDTFAGLVPQLFEEFANFNGLRIRIINAITPTASVHSVLKTLALTMRTNQASIQVVLGCVAGDILLAESNAAHPIQRAKVLNSGDVVMAGMGIDGKASYLSASPLVAGMISANSVKRNLTNDSINAVSVEKTFGEFNKDTETYRYVNSGVVLFGTGPKGFYLVQGLNTYQNHATIWNEQDDTSYLIQQRNIIDYVYEGYKSQMAEGVGADGYGPTVASVQGLAILKQYFNDGFITEYKMIKAYREANAVITNPLVKPIEATDFVGFKLTVLVEG
jgi:hypothetical protein